MPRLIFPIFLGAFLAFSFGGEIFAEEAVCDSVVSCRAKIAEFQKKIEDLKNKEKTFGNEIAFMDSQIGLTTAKIAEVASQLALKEKELADLSREIEDLEIRLDRVSRSLNAQREVFAQRALAAYKNSLISPLELLLGANSFSELVMRVKYLKILERQDQKLLKQMEETRKNFMAQKVIVRDKKEKVGVVKQTIESEKKELDTYKSSLSAQRKEKQLLLSATKNDEAKYQALLAQALAEKDALERAVAGLSLKDGQPVKAGEAVALMGNSGYPSCSTGAHLHLEVRRGGQAISPADYLAGHDVVYEDGTVPMNYGGSWAWPLNDTVIVSQEFGMSFWAKRGFYGGGPHTGIDMFNRDDYVIRAVADGTLYKGSVACGKSIMKYVAIDHGDEVFSYYFHVQ